MGRFDNIDYKFLVKYKQFIINMKEYKKLEYNFLYYCYHNIIESEAYDKSLIFSVDWMELELPKELLDIGFCFLFYNIKEKHFKTYYTQDLLKQSYITIINIFHKLLSDCVLVDIDEYRQEFQYKVEYKGNPITPQIICYETYWMLGEPYIEVIKGTTILLDVGQIVLGGYNVKLKTITCFNKVKQPMFFIVENSYLFLRYFRTDYISNNVIYYFCVGLYEDLIKLFSFILDSVVIKEYEPQCLIDMHELNLSLNNIERLKVKHMVKLVSEKYKNVSVRW